MNRRDLGLLFGGFIVGAITGLAFREKREMKEISPKEFFDMAKKNGGEASVTMKFKPAESEQVPQHQAPVIPPQMAYQMAQYNQGELSEENKARIARDVAKSLSDLKKKRDNGEELTQDESMILDAADKKDVMVKMMIPNLESRLRTNNVFLSQDETFLYRQLKEQKGYGVELSDNEEKAFELLSKFVQLKPENA